MLKIHTKQRVLGRVFVDSFDEFPDNPNGLHDFLQALQEFMKMPSDQVVVYGYTIPDRYRGLADLASSAR